MATKCFSFYRLFIPEPPLAWPLLYINKKIDKKLFSMDELMLNFKPFVS